MFKGQNRNGSFVVVVLMILGAMFLLGVVAPFLGAG